MYVPAHAREERIDVLHAAINDIAFGTLVTVRDGTPVMTHLPVYLIDRGPLGTLAGHIARPNDQWRDASGTQAALALVGPQFYVSPGMYPSKHDDGKVVPTWNYIAVQARGTIEFFNDRDRLLQLVSTLTDRFEATRERPWHVSDAPTDYIDHQLRGIVGFELPIASLQGAWKLSRNRSAADRNGVADGAAQHPDPHVRGLAVAIRDGATDR